MTKEPSKLERSRQRLYNILEVSAEEDTLGRGYDIINLISIVINLTTSIMYTFDDLRMAYGELLLSIEAVTVAFFAFDYVLRLWTSKYLYPKLSEGKALWSYIKSFKGLVDLVSFLPYYLPIFFPGGAAAFRLFRVLRLFRLFRVNAYYDSFSVILEVLDNKRQQLYSSVFIIAILLLGSSLCMYSLEHEAQPDVFKNAFSGIWWAVSTLLTVGYGDIYPITPLGQSLSIFITFLGVGMVAIPTGIISAGFVDQYSRIKRISEYGKEDDVNFIKVEVTESDNWNGKQIMDLGLPTGIIVAAIQREDEVLIPRGNTVLNVGDALVLGAPSMDHDHPIDLKEVIMRRQHPWNGQRIRDLDISRQTIIIMVKRNGKAMIPNGNTVLLEGDRVILYTQVHMAAAGHIYV